MGVSEAATYPLELDLDRQRELRIRWADGAQTAVSLLDLRLNCPCATCRAEREARAQNPLRVLGAAPNAEQAGSVQDAEVLGTYALRITWNDGHNTGLYDFRLLRSLSRPVADGGLAG